MSETLMTPTTGVPAPSSYVENGQQGSTAADPTPGTDRSEEPGILADDHGSYFENWTLCDVIKYIEELYHERLRFDLKKEGKLQSDFAMVCEKHGLNPALAPQIVAFVREKDAELAVEAGLKANAIPGPTVADGGDRPGEAPMEVNQAFATAATGAKILWADRNNHDVTRGLNPVEFIKVVFAVELAAETLTRSDLRRDKRLYQSYATHIIRYPDHDLGLPRQPRTKHKDEDIRAILDTPEPEQIATYRAVAAALTRQNQERKRLKR